MSSARNTRLIACRVFYFFFPETWDNYDCHLWEAVGGTQNDVSRFSVHKGAWMKQRVIDWNLRRVFRAASVWKLAVAEMSCTRSRALIKSGSVTCCRAQVSSPLKCPSDRLLSERRPKWARENGAFFPSARLEDAWRSDPFWTVDSSSSSRISGTAAVQ